MADVKWIKIRTDIFDNRKIKQIESLPEGDAIVVIWYKLLCLAGNINDGGAVYFTKDIPFTEEMLATAFNRSLNIIKLALVSFEKFEMIEVFEEIIYVANWEKYQNIDGMERIKEQTKKRVQKHRSLKKIECNVTVTQGNAIDIDIEEDKDKDLKDIYSPAKPLKTDNIPYKEIIEYLNLKSKTSFRDSSEKTKTLIKARYTDRWTLEDFKYVIDIKSKEWMDTEHQKYLRPETLFGTKFENYRNQKSFSDNTKPLNSRNQKEVTDEELQKLGGLIL